VSVILSHSIHDVSNSGHERFILLCEWYMQHVTEKYSIALLFLHVGVEGLR